MDPILYWNDVALEANKVSQILESDKKEKDQPGPALGSRALAIVHIAMYDAYAATALSAKLPSYFDNLPNPAAGALPNSAVAYAAYVTLSNLFPLQKAFFDNKLAQAGLDQEDSLKVQNGADFGRLVAKKILDERSKDPNSSDNTYISSSAPGHHRVDPDNPGQGFYAPFYGDDSKCFGITERFQLDQPPSGPEFSSALEQVRVKGIAPELIGNLPPGSDIRTVDESLIGVFWSYDGTPGLGTPPRLYNQIVRKVAIAKKNSTEQNALLFVLVNVAMADAAILAWTEKYDKNLWRPVLAIREGADPFWLPFGAQKSNPNPPSAPEKNFTPNFPAYPSGHATFGAAAFQVTRLFYGVTEQGPDNLLEKIDILSDELNGVSKDNKGTIRPKRPRQYPGGLWEAIIENGLSRVFLGVHWVFDAFAVDDKGNPDLSQNIGGVPLGLNVAQNLFDSAKAKGWGKRAAGKVLQ